MDAENLEKRRLERFPCGYEVRLLHSTGGQVESALSIVDMSCSGLGILTSLPLAVGDALGLKLTLSSGAVNASCRVRWARPEGRLRAYGLEFEGLRAIDRGRLGLLLKPEAAAALEIVTLGLEYTLAVMALAVLYDLIRSNPALLSAVLSVLPFGLVVAAIGGGLRLLSLR
ncbi:MAG: PilZ domain-containing protein [Elusimicrobia bacterium]|nr:PilZ domain-containing protein [Elusimicrobiota bacterium]